MISGSIFSQFTYRRTSSLTRTFVILHWKSSYWQEFCQEGPSTSLELGSHFRRWALKMEFLLWWVKSGHWLNLFCLLFTIKNWCKQVNPVKPSCVSCSWCNPGTFWANHWPFSCIYSKLKMILSGQTCGGCGGCGRGNYSIVCHGFVGYRLLRNCGHRRTLNTMTPTGNCCTLFFK